MFLDRGNAPGSVSSSQSPRQYGWEIVMNQPRPEIDRIRTITAGTRNTPLLTHCGTPLVEWTPQHLHTPPDDLTGTDRQKWFDERAEYQWVVIQHYPDGRKKLICPQCAGNAGSTARTRNPSRANRGKQHTNTPSRDAANSTPTHLLGMRQTAHQHTF